jgi:glycosyltransferase involved in cell wall biosynthesis
MSIRDPRRPLISVIATVLNEGESIHRLLDSLAAQTQLPDDIVIVDGGSSDSTVAIMHSYEGRLPLRVLLAPGCSISTGRNIAVRTATGAIIASTDAGVTLEPDWLERITRPLVEDPQVQVVGGFFRADPHTAFEAAMGAAVLPLLDEIDSVEFLPSSRSVAFRKSAWLAIGGYPEWLDFCEDLIFDLRLKQIAPGRGFLFEPGAMVRFRPRGSLSAFYRQYYLYARGDGKADLWRERHAVRYATYLLVAPFIAWLGKRVHPLLWLLFVPGAAAYLRRPYQRLGRVLNWMPQPPSFGQRVFAAGLIPVIRVVGDIAKMIGYPVGWLWRLREQPPEWRSAPWPESRIDRL